MVKRYRVTGEMGKPGRRVVDEKGRPIGGGSRRRKAQAKPKGSKYIIKRGDTLSGIAKRMGTTVSRLMAMNPQIKDKNKIRAGATLNISGTKAGARSVAAKKIKTIPTLKVKGRALKTAKQRREENKAKRKESDEKHEKAVERRLAGKSAERRTESAIQRGDARYPAGGGTRAITKEESDEQARIRKERRGDRTRDKYRGRRSWWRQLTR